MLLLIDLQMTLLGAMAAVLDLEPWLLYWTGSHGGCIGRGAMAAVFIGLRVQ